MTSEDPEWNRDGFDPARLLAARAASWALLDEAFAALAPGMTSDEARARVDALLVSRTGRRPWHPTQLRADAETVLPFGAKPERPTTLARGSAVFVDMGPLIEGYEGDVAATRLLGDARTEEGALGAAARTLHEELVGAWKLHRLTGRALYARAGDRARAMGLTLATRGASGHRLADHPHAVRGALRTLDRCPRSCAWVLEIHLVDEAIGRGAFFEDLLV